MSQKMSVHRSCVLGLFFLALVIRLVFLGATYQENGRVKYMEDVGIAINLLEGRGYVFNVSMVQRDVPVRPTAWKPPVYPMLVVLVFFVFGMKNFLALFLIHAL